MTEDVTGKDRGVPFRRVAFAPSAKELRRSMTATHVNAKKPVLKLRFGPRSSEPRDPDPAPVSAPKPPPKPVPAMNPERAARIAELEEVARAARAAGIAKTVEAHKPGKAELKSYGAVGCPMR